MVGLLSKRKTLEKGDFGLGVKINSLMWIFFLKKMAKSNLFSDVILVAECVFIYKSKLIQQLAIAV